ncbi:hypothetical protein JCM8097_004410 [Rhodosporidiobolus ruineniae]
MGLKIELTANRYRATIHHHRFKQSDDNLPTYESSLTFYVDAYPTSIRGFAFSTAATSDFVTFQYPPTRTYPYYTPPTRRNPGALVALGAALLRRLAVFNSYNLIHTRTLDPILEAPPSSFDAYVPIRPDELGSGDDEALEIHPRATTVTGRRRQNSGGAPFAHRRSTSEQKTLRQRGGPQGGSEGGGSTTSATSASSPGRKRSRIWTPVLVFLQVLSVIPGLIGFIYSAHRFWSPSHLVWLSSTWEASGNAVGITSARSTRLDWFVSGMWALATAYFTFQLARGLLRRWLVYYSMGPTIIRVISLQAICWPLTLTTHRVLSFDQPVAAWCVCATTAAISNVIQTWVTSNIVERKDRRNQQRWKIYSAVVTAVLGPGIRTDKYRKGERVVSWKRVLWGTVLPFALLSWSTSAALLWQQYSARYHGGGGISLGRPLLNGSYFPSPSSAALPARTLNTVPDLDHSANIRIMVLVTSSWTNRSLTNRHTFRETSVRLFPRSTPALSVSYRFLLGAAPSPQTAARAGPGIEAEADEFGDVLVVPAHDDYDHLSQKIYEGWRWASELDVDYVFKTDDDILLRMDVLAKEFVQLGRRNEYWRGFAYWDIPAIKDASNKNADFSYDLATFPPYTAGALHILSKDLVDLIAPPSTPRRFVKNEDQNLGLWLYPSGIRPIHDVRIQQAQVCENDMIAKHFGSQYREPNGIGPREMYANIIAGRKQCEGLLQDWCGVCYPSCRKRKNHWSNWGFACDDIKGATLSSRPSALALAAGTGALDQPVKVPAPPLVIGSADDPWVIPGLLSQHASPFSATDDWHLLHMLCWTTAVETFQERHYQALETIWAHEPRAVLFMFSTTLPSDFFDDYTRHGYAIHVVRVGKKEMLERRWFLGPQSERWLQDWEQWEKGPSFFSHLTDYLRYFFLFSYGGTYLDMDAPWIRSPPNSKLEFIGADYSTVASDLDWTLDEDGMYLAPGVMRFRRGWTLFRDIMESAFSAKYSPDCFNCVGPRAITSGVRSRRHQLEQHGFTIVPPHVLYPRNWVLSHELVCALPPGEGRAELARIARESWSIHLFGKMTNHLRIQPGSVVGEAFDTFSLRVPRRVGLLSSSDGEYARSSSSQAGLDLRFPPSYTFRARTTEQQLETPHLDLLGSLDGRFDGLDLVSLRGLPSSFASLSSSSPPRAPAKLRLSTSAGGRVALAPSSARLAGRTAAGEGELAAASEAVFTLQDASLRDINAVLAGVVYVPPRSDGSTESKQDELRVEVEWGGEKVEGRIALEVPPPPPVPPSATSRVGLGMAAPSSSAIYIPVAVDECEVELEEKGLSELEDALLPQPVLIRSSAPFIEQDRRARWRSRLVQVLAPKLIVSSLRSFLRPPSGENNLQNLHAPTPGNQLDTMTDPFVLNLEDRLANPPIAPYKSVVATVERDGGRDVVEWLLYHINLGFEHFIVYDSGSQDDTAERLKPFTDLGWVTFVPYETGTPRRAFQLFIETWRSLSKWHLFLGTDEFIVRNETLLAGTGELDEPFFDWFERRYGDYGSVSLGAVTFSPSQLEQADDLSSLSTTATDSAFANDSFATLARHISRGGSLEIGKTTLHDSQVRLPLLAVDANGKSGKEKWEGKGGYPVYIQRYPGECDKKSLAKKPSSTFVDPSASEINCPVKPYNANNPTAVTHPPYPAFAPFAPSLAAALSRFEARYPLFSPTGFTVSLLHSPASNIRTRLSFDGHQVEGGERLVVDSLQLDVGHLEVVLTTPTSRRYLPTLQRPDRGVSFSLPASLESGSNELLVVRQYASTPDPVTRDPVSQCSIMGHLGMRPNQPQLLALHDGPCKGVATSGQATAAWPQAHYRGDELFRLSFEVEKQTPPVVHPPDVLAPLSFAQLGQGRWLSYPYSTFSNSSSPFTPPSLGTPRLVTPSRCPNQFEPSYWSSFANESAFLSPSVLRWVPDTQSDFREALLGRHALRTCLQPEAPPADQRPETADPLPPMPPPRRIVLVGDSMMEHTSWAAECLVEQVGLDPQDHIQYSNAKYEMFDITDGTATSEMWERFFAFGSDKLTPSTTPDVVVLNIGIWAATWSSLSAYSSGLASSFALIASLSAKHGFPVLFRETSALFPRAAHDAPMYQINPRVRRLNEIARGFVEEWGWGWVPSYEMTAARADAARDNAHVAPWVQGDMAELLLYGLCRHVLEAKAA